jgi:anti-anti-sigma regulatory factor
MTGSFVDGVYNLPSRVDISCAVDVYKEINEAVSDNKNITFSASNVERITTPGIQLLISAANTIKAKGGTFLVSWPSDIFKETLSDLGFSNQLKEWTGSNV